MKFDRPFMEMAYIWAKQSYCIKRQVGAIISIEDHIISHGYNGTSSGLLNECEETIECPKCNGSGELSLFPVAGKTECDHCQGTAEVLKTSPFTIHAEANAILWAAKKGISTEGATIYVTTSPCIDCSKMIASAGIVRVVYSEDYKCKEGPEFLESLGIKVERYN